MYISYGVYDISLHLHNSEVDCSHAMNAARRQEWLCEDVAYADQYCTVDISTPDEGKVVAIGIISSNKKFPIHIIVSPGGDYFALACDKSFAAYRRDTIALKCTLPSRCISIRCLYEKYLIIHELGFVVIDAVTCQESLSVDTDVLERVIRTQDGAIVEDCNCTIAINVKIMSHTAVLK